jgi:hypothetical protein
MHLIKIMFAIVTVGGTSYAIWHVKRLPFVIQFLADAALSVSIIVGGFQVLNYYEKRFGPIFPPKPPYDDPTQNDWPQSDQPPVQTLDTIVAPVGKTVGQIKQCIERNSKKFILDEHYSLKSDRDNAFDEVIVKMHIQDPILHDLIRDCTKFP